MTLGDLFLGGVAPQLCQLKLVNPEKIHKSNLWNKLFSVLHYKEKRHQVIVDQINQHWGNPSHIKCDIISYQCEILSLARYVCVTDDVSL